jgi:hypothetical protein
MWTDEDRPRYNRVKLRYPSDLTDEEWALVETQRIERAYNDAFAGDALHAHERRTHPGRSGQGGHFGSSGQAITALCGEKGSGQ